MPYLLPPLSRETGEGAARRRRPGAGGLGVRRLPWCGGKEGGRSAGSIPGRSSGGGGARRPGHGGRRLPWSGVLEARWQSRRGRGARGDQECSIPYLGSGWGAARRGAPRWLASWRRRQWRWRRWELGEGARSGSGGRGGDELCGEPLYRRSRSVEEERGGGGGRRAQRGALMAFGRLRVSRSGARAARRSQGDGTARAGAASGAGGAVLDGGRRGEQCRRCCAWARTGADGCEDGARTWPCSLTVVGVRASR